MPQTPKRKCTLLYTILTGAVVLLMPSCVGFNQYNGIQPVSPLPPARLSQTRGGFGQSKTPSGVPVVDSLQPTLSWTPVDSGKTIYDLEVCLGAAKLAEAVLGYNNGNVAYGPGKQVYYRESIAGSSHRLEQPLSPSTVYVWSVRTRSGDEVGPWSTYNFQEFNLGGQQWGTNLWWPFITLVSKSDDISGQPPQIPAGQGRIYFYREKRFVGLAMEPHILLNAETVGNSMNGGYFYVDRPPGNYVVHCSNDRNGDHQITVTLAAGDIKYVQTSFVSFHIESTLVDKDTAVKTLSECSYMPNISP